MANPKSTVAVLAQEIGLLLRHDNIDARIYEWIGLVLNDLVQRIPSHFFASVTEVTVATGTDSIAFSPVFGSPLAAVFLNALDVVHMPEQLSENDFTRLVETSGTVADSAVPLAWAVMTDGSTMKLHIFPGASGAIEATVFWVGGAALDAPPTGASRLPLPYHFEHVLIWGAAAHGAQVLRAPIAPLYMAEYEEAVQDMYAMLTYKPDAQPTLRSIHGGPYTGQRLIRGAPRIPDTIG